MFHATLLIYFPIFAIVSHYLHAISLEYILVLYGKGLLLSQTFFGSYYFFF